MAGTPGDKIYHFKYDKLVRDKMPSIIRQEGWSLKQKKLSRAGFKKALLAKLKEEVDEFLAVQDRASFLSELADIQEIVEALLVSNDFCRTDLVRAGRLKRKRVGGYEKRIYLESISYLPGADRTWLKYHLKNEKKFPLIK